MPRFWGKTAGATGHAIRKEVGYLPGELHFYRGLTGRRTLEFLSSARRLDCKAEAARLQERFDLDLDLRVRSYSSGMKQKLGLIQALMHRPRLLILDEPTNGLDPLIRRELYDELRTVVAEGRTVLFSSHTLSEVDELCEEVIILRGGRIVEHDRVDSLRRRARGAWSWCSRTRPLFPRTSLLDSLASSEPVPGSGDDGPARSETSFTG